MSSESRDFFNFLKCVNLIRYVIPGCLSFCCDFDSKYIGLYGVQPCAERQFTSKVFKTLSDAIEMQIIVHLFLTLHEIAFHNCFFWDQLDGWDCQFQLPSVNFLNP